MSQYELEMAFWKWLMIAIGGIGLMWIVGNHIEDILQGIVDFFGAIGENARYRRATKPRRKRQRRVRQWKIAIPFLTWHRRQKLKKEFKRADKQARDLSNDFVAETLATEQEVMETMFGEAPTAPEITFKIMNKRK